MVEKTYNQNFDSNAPPPKKSSEKPKKKRSKREIFPAGTPVFVETAVFVDKDLFEHMSTNYPEETERELIRFVLAMINAVITQISERTLE